MRARQLDAKQLGGPAAAESGPLTDRGALPLAHGGPPGLSEQSLGHSGLQCGPGAPLTNQDAHLISTDARLRCL